MLQIYAVMFGRTAKVLSFACRTLSTLLVTTKFDKGHAHNSVWRKQAATYWIHKLYTTPPT